MVRLPANHLTYAITEPLAQSEEQLERQLHDPRIFRGCDRAKPLESSSIRTDGLGICDVPVWQIKLGVVEGVEQFCTELEIHAFLNERIFQQSHIPVVEAGARKEPPPRIAQRTWRRLSGFRAK